MSMSDFFAQVALTFMIIMIMAFRPWVEESFESGLFFSILGFPEHTTEQWIPENHLDRYDGTHSWMDDAA